MKLFGDNCVFQYFCSMDLYNNIKAIREDKGLKQIEVATHINVDKSAYSKIEKGQRNITVDELQKMAQLFNVTTDHIISYDGTTPKEITIEVLKK